jgi:hypothetical protein
LEALFGNRTAACILLFLQCYGEGHAQRIAKTFGFGLNMTQRQLKRLEEQGVLVSRRLGNMRLFSFNERNPTVRNLQKLLEVELAALPEDDQQQYFRPSEIQASGGSSRQLRLETRVIPVPVPSPAALGDLALLPGAEQQRHTAGSRMVLEPLAGQAEVGATAALQLLVVEERPVLGAKIGVDQLPGGDRGTTGHGTLRKVRLY